MARTPPQFANLGDEPTIIIDPSLYVPERRTLLQGACDTFLSVTRAVVVAALAGTTMFSVAHVLRYQSLTHRAHAHEPVVIEMHPAELTEAEAEVELASAGFAAVPSRPTSIAERNTEAVLTEAALAPQPEPAVVAAVPAPTAAPVARASAEKPAAVASEPTIDLMSVVRDGRRMLAMGRLDDAETAFRSVLAERSGQPAALSGLARVHLGRGQLDQALVFAQRAVDAAPYQASYHVALGDVLRVNGETVAADAQYELAARLNPKKADQADKMLPPNPFF